ncbi:MAG: hypothetical protein IPP44_12370 [Ideonella sp.]|nr:hypothetical protein [Ideonella sp.]
MSGYAGLERNRISRYNPATGDEWPSFAAISSSSVPISANPGAISVNCAWAGRALILRTVPQLFSTDYTGFNQRVSWIEDALRARVVVDQLDFASFPQSGYRGEAQVWAGRRSGTLSGNFNRLEAEGTAVRTWGAHTLNLHAQLQIADQGNPAGIERYALGGFHQLSGYQAGQLSGNDVLFARLTWYRRLSQTPALTRGFFVGGTLEAGNAWVQSSDIRLTRLRTGASLFIGADTGVGPLFLGITYAPQGSTGLALFIGRP